MHAPDWKGAGGSLSGAEWAEGFVRAMHLRLKAWGPLMRSKRSGDLVRPILALAQDEQGKHTSGLLESAALDLVLTEVANVIAVYVRGIAAYWHKRRTRPSRSRARLKPNAAALDQPCPCGSGQPYKLCRLCCGQPH